MEAGVISRFEFDGFVPKPELIERAQSMMNDIMEKIPSDANIIGECKKRFGKYYLKVVVNGSNTLFEANTIVDPMLQIDSKERDWLSKAIEALHGNVKLQIRNWLITREIDC